MSLPGFQLLVALARRRAASLGAGTYSITTLQRQPADSGWHTVVPVKDLRQRIDDVVQSRCQLAQRAGTNCWLPTVEENEVIATLDAFQHSITGGDHSECACGLPSAQLLYAALMKLRFTPNSIGSTGPVGDEDNGVLNVLDFADEVAPLSSADSSELSSWSNCTAPACRLVVPASESKLMQEHLLLPVAVTGQLFDLMCELVALLQDHSIACWVSSGTLLGGVRQGTILPWDDDVDMCIFEHDVPALLQLFSPDDQGVASRRGFVLEYVPLFGYKVYHRPLPPPSRYQHGSQAGRCRGFTYGIFVDLFVVRASAATEGPAADPSSTRFVFARESARRTWPSEWWRPEEIGVPPAAGSTPRLSSGRAECRRSQLAQLSTVSIADPRCSTRRVSVPAPRDSKSYLHRLYGATCLHEAVIPSQLHGCRQSHAIHIPHHLLV